MIGSQFILPLAHELVVDLFAGGGGASTGIEQAIGRHVDIAVNHDPQAVSLHEVNHPQTRHYVSDVFEVDPLTVTAGRPVGLLWASPDCKHFSKAKGGKPVAKKIRGLAGVVIKWAKAVQPRMIFLENVEEFQTWGPLLKGGKPCPKRKGRTFHHWKSRLENLGYVIEYRELRACDYGAPTIRKRLFLVARRDGKPIVWPEPTHGPGRKPYLTAADCIDWDILAPSIFERDKPLKDSTLRRIAHGIKRYVLDSDKPFIVPGLAAPLLIDSAHSDVSPSGVKRWSHGNRPITGQLPTVVASGGNSALVAAYLAKHFGGDPAPGKTGQPVDAPAPTVLAQGGPQALVAAHLTKLRTGSVGSAADEPVHTVTAGGTPKRPSTGNVMGLVTSNLVKLRGTSNSAGTAEPLHTVSAQGTHHAEVRALLLKYYGTDQDPRLDEPMHTVTTKHRFGVVTVLGQDYVIADIGMRMLQPRELYRAQGFPENYVIDRGADGRALPKDAQVRMCGNSVCPPLARAIVAANYAEQKQAAANDNSRKARAA
jgi:DNA (cytosine-5)-methyltransferase 1